MFGKWNLQLARLRQISEPPRRAPVFDGGGKGGDDRFHGETDLNPQQAKAPE